MDDYKGIDCPICGKALDNGEPVAVCPDCGAPYHKDCIVKTGKCVYDELHAAGKHWQQPKVQQAEETEEQAFGAVNKCPRCGVVNPADGLFCEVCGSSLKAGKRETGEGAADGFDGNRYHGNAGPNMRQDAPRGQGFQAPPQQMPHYPFTTPFGGLDPEDSIDDIPIKDMAIFVGQNTPYFLPKFKAYSDRKGSMTFNFAAFFFQSFYFLYRKMYFWGIFIFVVTTLLDIPNLLMMFDRMRVMFLGQDVELWFSETELTSLAGVLSTFGFMVRIICGFFANRMYKSHAVSKIKQIQSKDLNHNAYVVNLTKSGSVSMKFIIALIAVYILFSYFAVFLMMFY